MGVNVFLVDAFTDKAFAGNPAGVVADENLDDATMQVIAREINASETAFIKQYDDDLFKVRFFTPTEEVDLCGHATIGAFFVLASKGYVHPIKEGRKKLEQITKAGRLPVFIDYKDYSVDKVSMEQAEPKSFGKVKDLSKLAASLNLSIADLGFSWSDKEAEILSTGLKDIILPVKSKEVLDRIKINKDLLIELSKENDVVGVHAFTMEKNSNIIYARNFAPLVGIDEESATGTSNGATIFYLKKNGLLESNEMIAYQGESLNRESEIICSIDGNKIIVGGRARMSIDGILTLS